MSSYSVSLPTWLPPNAAGPPPPCRTPHTPLHDWQPPVLGLRPVSEGSARPAGGILAPSAHQLSPWMKPHLAREVLWCRVLAIPGTMRQMWMRQSTRPESSHPSQGKGTRARLLHRAGADPRLWDQTCRGSALQLADCVHLGNLMSLHINFLLCKTGTMEGALNAPL